MNKIIMCNRYTQLNRLCGIIYRSYSKSSTTQKEVYPKRIFSGIQPTGSIHIGNYFGAIKQWVNLQNQNENMLLSIVDLHSVTLSHNPALLQKNILEMTATLIACGIDPEKTVLFLQSSVPQHSELCWILGCYSTMARLAHLPQYKEKSETLKEVPLGLYIYPILQAADILLYKATHVPVGQDQIQHLQMAQQIVKTVNHKFGKIFPTPTSIIADDTCSRVKSLRNPDKKMSKSDPDPKATILLTDSPSDIKNKFKKAVTDFTPEVTYDLITRPSVANMINIHCMIANKIPEEICEESDGINMEKYKYVVADAVCEYLKPIREKMDYLLSKPEYLIDVLEKGSTSAKKIAEVTMQEVFSKIGLGIPKK